MQEAANALDFDWGGGGVRRPDEEKVEFFADFVLSCACRSVGGQFIDSSGSKCLLISTQMIMSKVVILNVGCVGASIAAFVIGCSSMDSSGHARSDGKNSLSSRSGGSRSS